jgi:hypothetical protein
VNADKGKKQQKKERQVVQEIKRKSLPVGDRERKTQDFGTQSPYSKKNQHKYKTHKDKREEGEVKRMVSDSEIFSLVVIENKDAEQAGPD